MKDLKIVVCFYDKDISIIATCNSNIEAHKAMKEDFDAFCEEANVAGEIYSSSAVVEDNTYGNEVACYWQILSVQI